MMHFLHQSVTSSLFKLQYYSQYHVLKGTARAVSTATWATGWASDEQQLNCWHVQQICLFYQLSGTHSASYLVMIVP
jgi:hypothetical protein